MDELMNACCPNGHPSGPFFDPRVQFPYGRLGSFSCNICQETWPLIDILRAQDERDLQELLG